MSHRDQTRHFVAGRQGQFGSERLRHEQRPCQHAGAQAHRLGRQQQILNRHGHTQRFPRDEFRVFEVREQSRRQAHGLLVQSDQ